MKNFILTLAFLLISQISFASPDCGPVLQTQFAAIMNAQSGWSFPPKHISLASLVSGLYTVVAGPQVGKPGSEYLVAIWGERDCLITSMVESKEEAPAVDIHWK